MPGDPVIAQLVGRRAIRSALPWGCVFALYVVASISGYLGTYRTVASRQQLARALTPNVGLRALIGPARHLDTAAGFASWRCLGVLSVVGALWGLLAATRLLRGEEDAGRWELLLSGPTTRRRAAVEGLVGLGAGWFALFALTAVATLADGQQPTPAFTPSGSLFFALALSAGAAMFASVGALTSQLAATRPQAASLAGGVLGLAFVLRMVGDSGAGLHWIVWFSPLGWLEQLSPLVGSRPVLLVPIVCFVAGCSGLAVELAARRDVGASVLPDRTTARPRLRLLSNPATLAVRLVRPVALAWIAALSAAGLLFGLVAQSAANATTGSATVQRALSRLGGRHGGAAAYLGITFLIVATMVGLIAGGQVVATREEEAEGRLDNLLAGRSSRWAWLAGRLGVTLGVLLLGGLGAGLAAWLGAASQHSGIALGTLAGAGINTVPPAVLLLGVGTLAHAAVPRAAGAVAYGLIAWSFLIEFVGSVVKMSHWMLDTSVLYHVAPSPATSPHWVSASALVALGVVAAAAAGGIFSRRDLISA